MTTHCHGQEPGLPDRYLNGNIMGFEMKKIGACLVLALEKFISSPSSHVTQNGISYLSDSGGAHGIMDVKMLRRSQGLLHNLLSLPSSLPPSPPSSLPLFLSYLVSMGTEGLCIFSYNSSKLTFQFQILSIFKT